MKKWILVLSFSMVLVSIPYGLEAGDKGKTKSSSSSKRKINPSFLKPEPVKTKINEPSDLLNLVPFIKEINQIIPRQFSLVNHEFRLDPNQVVIKHQFLDERVRSVPKNSIISLSYYGDLGRQLETQLDVPLFYSSFYGYGISDWNRYPVGNYTMTITQNRYLENRLFIRAQTRF